MQLLELGVPKLLLRDHDSFGVEDFLGALVDGSPPRCRLAATAVTYCDVSLLAVEQLTDLLRVDDQFREAHPSAIAFHKLRGHLGAALRGAGRGLLRPPPAASLALEQPLANANASDADITSSAAAPSSAAAACSTAASTTTTGTETPTLRKMRTPPLYERVHERDPLSWIHAGIVKMVEELTRREDGPAPTAAAATSASPLAAAVAAAMKP